MDNLGDILAKRNLVEPDEVRVIKDFIEKNFNSSATVTIKTSQIVIGVSGSALAGSLRLQLQDLQKLCSTDKKLIIRIESK